MFLFDSTGFQCEWVDRESINKIGYHSICNLPYSMLDFMPFFVVVLFANLHCYTMSEE